MRAWGRWIVCILIILVVLGLIYLAWYMGKTAILWLFIIYFG